MKISLPDIFPSEEILITEVRFQHEIEFYGISTTHFLAGDIFFRKGDTGVFVSPGVTCRL